MACYVIWPFQCSKHLLRIMTQTLHPFIRKFVVYFDDILVYSRNPLDHIEHLRFVLVSLRQAKFYVNLKKCSFMISSLVFLGFILTHLGVMVDEDKIEAVREWLAPKNLHEACSFLGLASFYYRSIRNFNTIATPLTNCLKKGEFMWTPKAEKSFKIIKKRAN